MRTTHWTSKNDRWAIEDDDGYLRIVAKSKYGTIDCKHAAHLIHRFPDAVPAYVYNALVKIAPNPYTS